MLVLRIHIATTHFVGLSVHQVEFDDTCDISEVFMLCGTLLGGQFEEHTRCQCHLIVTGSGVALTTVGVGGLPLIVGGMVVGIAGVRCTYVVHTYVAGQVAQIVHRAIDTEIIAVSFVGIVGLTGRRVDLHQRELTYAVDGVAVVVEYRSHTVASALQHHTTSEHAHEVGALDSVQQTSGIDRTETVLIPVGTVVYILLAHSLVQVGQIIVFVLIDLVTYLMAGIGDTLFVLTAIKGSLTGKAQTEVGTLAVGQRVIFVHLDTLLQSVVVGAVVRDVQLTIAVNQREVAAAIQSTDMFGTDSDEITAINIAQGSCGVAEDGDGVGIYLVTTHSHITAGKHGIANDDTAVIECGPLWSIRDIGLAFQLVQLVGRHIVILVVGRAIDGHTAG